MELRSAKSLLATMLRMLVARVRACLRALVITGLDLRCRDGACVDSVEGSVLGMFVRASFSYARKDKSPDAVERSVWARSFQVRRNPRTGMI
jgi:hypothetical protein